MYTTGKKYGIFFNLYGCCYFVNNFIKVAIYCAKFAMYILCVGMLLTKTRSSVRDQIIDPGVPQGDALKSVKFEFLYFGPQNCKSSHTIKQAISTIAIRSRNCSAIIQTWQTDPTCQ